ncbi:MAG TPA: type II toxin-antitoxin system VapB family antitoxin [Chloroflexota bacterium]|jgi:Arc/MetJ family transcription regulator|nr:type II toxin-antitoxin system VapB family antitoxin [Chloroflexota bacterium]
MPKTSIDIDRDIARQAAEILGTSTPRETVDAALHEVVRAQMRQELIRLFSEPGRFDFEAAEHAWGGDS